MKKLRIILYQHFGFSRTESNGILFLLIIILLMLLTKHLYFNYIHKPTQLKISQVELEGIRKKIREKKLIEVKEKKSLNEKKDPSSVIVIDTESEFDPNESTAEELMKMGFPEEISYRIISYREKVGKFSGKSDLFKIYNIDSSFLIENWERILLPEKNLIETEEIPLNKIEQSDINIAGVSDFERINGIGNVFANRIIKYRNSLGGFYSIKQLNEVYNLPDSLIPAINQYFLIDKSKLKKLDLNSMTEKELGSHPYINYNLSRAIVNYRKAHDGYSDVTEIREIKLINDSIYHKIYPYLSIEKPDSIIK